MEYVVAFVFIALPVFVTWLVIKGAAYEHDHYYRKDHPND